MLRYNGQAYEAKKTDSHMQDSVARSKHYVISGRVQGVSYRANTQMQAKQMGLTGWVRNLNDGRVEALATGEPEALARFEQWLHQGPSFAHVTEVEVRETELQQFPCFTILY